ncbi:MAG: alanine--tRNA ligase [Kiritimatiellia bacterium]
MMTAAEVRQSFLDFFKGKQHVIVPSSPVVLPSDPTLLFTNAGMNQFKEIFLGARESQFRRVADTQKCIRVSGKHNDLEEVGIDTYHHTFFEMLGNWSFGDYYKREAITWAWELLTGVWKLPKERLWVTVYRSDDEAAELWKSCTDIAPERILRFDEKDNFWEMGDTGPCGPCSEIHFDRTEKGCGPEMVNAGSPDCIEIWNLVFIQYNRKSDGSLTELPAKHVDTGMGFERVVSVIQGKNSNYDTDIFQPVISAVAKMSGRKYEGRDAIAMRVIADHLRALSSAIADGVLPSNDGRGYVLRRLLRRAVRYGRNIGLRKPFMRKLFPVLEEMMAGVFPELKTNRENVMRALNAEEESFAATLDRGIVIFDETVSQLKSKDELTFPGDEAFKLYDTYGFPLDLTVLMAHEQGLVVDQERFNELMDEQRARARGARKDAELAKEMDQISALVSAGVRSQFTGYTNLEDDSEIICILKDGKSCESVNAGDEAEIMLAKTPFYAESGGQMADLGVIRGAQGEFHVLDTQKPADGIILHIGKVVQGTFAKGEKVYAEIDKDRRGRLRRNHTATHLLNYALRTLVNPSIKQAGSLVTPERLRFDFNHYEAIPEDKIEEVEHLVNDCIMQSSPVETYEMALKDVHGSGIVAVFDEKYGDTVRVLDVGGYSRELCGGTHAHNTGELGLFRIVSESSIASGVRRIEAVSGWPAYEWTRREHELVRGLAHRFSSTSEKIPQRVDTLIIQCKKLEKDLKAAASQSALSKTDDLLTQQQTVSGATLLAADLGELPADNLREVMDSIRQKMPSGVIVLGSRADGKACFTASVSADLIPKGLHAGNLIKAVAAIAGGGGGGQPQKAQAGGKNPEKVGEAIGKAVGIVQGMIKG